MLCSDVRQGGLVALHVSKLSPLLVFEVEQQHSEVVGSHPQISFLVVTYLPDNDIVGHILESLGPHQFSKRSIPAFVLRNIYIGSCRVCDHPRDTILVVVKPIVIICIIQATSHIVIFPQHPAILIIDTHQFTQVRHQ